MPEKKNKRKVNRKGTSYKKAPYPDSDSIEVTSVKIFESLIDEKKVKTHINKRDKVPNTDGYVEPVDAENRSLGKIHVQVKTLSKADLDRRGHSSSEGFLGHCKDSLEPSILVGVYQENSEVFWEEVTPAMVERMEQKGTLTVRLPVENRIAKDKQDYYQKWIGILEKRRKAFRLFNELGSALEEQDVIKKALEHYTKGIPVEEKVDAEKIQEFLDEFNHLINYQFKVIANALYPTARKMGFAYSEYSKDRLFFTLFEIGKKSTDADIKKVPLKVFREIGRRFYFYNENPVEIRPKEYARKLIREDLFKVVDAGAIDMHDEVLARELIFDLLDKTYDKFGLKKKNRYSVKEIKKGFYEYLPRWIINTTNLFPTDKRFVISNVYNIKGYFDIGSLDFMLAVDFKEKIHALTKDQITKKQHLSFDLTLGYSDFPIRLFVSSLEYLEKKGVETVERLYPMYDYNRNPGPGSIFNWLSPNAFFEKVKQYYASFPSIYNTIAKENFPHIYSKIQYGVDIDRQVVLVRAFDKYAGHYDYPRIQVFNLVCTDSPHDLIIDVFDENNNQSPKFDFDNFDDIFEIDGKSYRAIQMSSAIADDFFHENLMYKKVIELLKSRLEEYFKGLDG